MTSLLWEHMSPSHSDEASHWDQGSVAAVLIALNSEGLECGRWVLSA